MMAASRAATTGAGMLQILCKIVVQIEDNIDEQKVWHKYTQRYIIPSFAHFARLQIWWIFGSCQLRCKLSVDGIRAVRSADTCDDLTSDVWTWWHVTWDHAMVTPVQCPVADAETGDWFTNTILSGLEPNDDCDNVPKKRISEVQLSRILASVIWVSFYWSKTISPITTKLRCSQFSNELGCSSTVLCWTVRGSGFRCFALQHCI